MTQRRQNETNPRARRRPARMASTGGRAAAAAAMLLCAIGGARAQNVTVSEPTGINLGLTSFYDGFGRGASGFVYLGYWEYAHLNALEDSRGHAIAAFRNPRVDVELWLNQFVYLFPGTLLGGHVGLTAIVPLTRFSSHFDTPGPVLRDDGFGIGDLAIGPVLQYDPIMLNGHPFMSNRFEIDFILPSGKYDRNADINQSSGYTSVNPSWAGTLLFAPRWELSWRLHYLYNFKNMQPASSDPMMIAGVRDTQAGQAVWTNFAASYSLASSLHVGINGYYFKQITRSRVNGTHQTGTEQLALAVGPGFLWEKSVSDKLFLNVYSQTDVKNQAAGDFAINFHWIHLF
jgi:hypothetical protein